MLRAFQWDLARQVERLDWLLAQLPRYADWGYQELYLHLEDAVEYPSLPGIARADAYAHRELGRLVDAATRVGIRVVPIVNLLGHTQYLIKVPSLRDLNELRAADGSPLAHGQICPVHPDTRAIAEKLLRDVAPFCTAGKVHVGLDESFQLGRHPLSRAEIAEIGLAAHFAGYVSRLRELTCSLGLRMGMWADMLYFLPEAVPLLPADIAAYEWYYYTFARRPRVELFNFAGTDLGRRLRARGIEYWGCPMNGAFRFEPLPHFTDRLENIVSWWRQCQRLNAAGMLVTSWEPYRLAIELTTVVDAAAASLWLDGIDDPRAMLERGFARVFGRRRPVSFHRGGPTVPPVPPAAYEHTYSPTERRKAKKAAQVALACDRHPFSGYPRWEINTRWDVISRREPLAPYQREERTFGRLRESRGLPAPLRASIEFRWYLAFRDVWVRQMLRRRAQPGGLRPALRVGLRAARAMWARTRDTSVRSPNEIILLGEVARLQALERGESVFGPRWQLCYRVHNIAPAAQLVAVEQLTGDAGWVTRQACHTIEFQSCAAARHGGFVREHAAPVDWDGNRDAPPELRVVLRGFGTVRITAVVLTDGRRNMRVRLPRNSIGTRAPRSGFPTLDWARNQDVIVLAVSGR
jgi:hypothetical protein